MIPRLSLQEENRGRLGKTYDVNLTTKILQLEQYDEKTNFRKSSRGNES